MVGIGSQTDRCPVTSTEIRSRIASTRTLSLGEKMGGGVVTHRRGSLTRMVVQCGTLTSQIMGAPMCPVTRIRTNICGLRMRVEELRTGVLLNRWEDAERWNRCECQCISLMDHYC